MDELEEVRKVLAQLEREEENLNRDLYFFKGKYKEIGVTSKELEKLCTGLLIDVSCLMSLLLLLKKRIRKLLEDSGKYNLTSFVKKALLEMDDDMEKLGRISYTLVGMSRILKEGGIEKLRG